MASERDAFGGLLPITRVQDTRWCCPRGGCGRPAVVVVEDIGPAGCTNRPRFVGRCELHRADDLPAECRERPDLDPQSVEVATWEDYN